MFNFLEIQFKTQLQMYVHLQFQMSLYFISLISLVMIDICAFGHS